MNQTRKHPDAICEECGLNNRVYVDGTKHFPLITQYPMLWIGQAPGEVESFTKQVFTGPAGKQHYSILKMAGLNKSLLPHENACACWPPKKLKGGDRPPTPKELACCKPRLRSIIHRIKPELIVALGEPSMRSLTGIASVKITSHNGRFYDLDPVFEWKCKVLCCLHPSFVMRARQWIPVSVNNYKLVHKFFQGEITEYREPEMLNDPDPDQLRKYLFTAEGVTACDTEATGLNYRQDTILGYSFAKDLNTSCAVYFTGSDDPRWPVVTEFLESPQYKKSWQNGTYDTGIARAHGIKDAGFVFDTRLAEQLLHSDLPSDLDQLRNQYTDIPPYKPPKKEMKKIASWGKEKMLRYANLDAHTTKRVEHEQRKEMTEKEIHLMETHLIPLVYALNEMTNAGMLVDQRMLALLYSQCQPVAMKHATPFYDAGINPNSPKQVAPFLGISSTGEDVLEHYINRGHPKAELMQSLLTYRKYNRMATTYLKNIFDRLEDGRIHTKFKIDGTGTGRLSSEDPNLQNVPPEMRAIYVPDPGCFLLAGDYSQVELWSGAIIADEPRMIKDLLDGRDIHYDMCCECYPQVPAVHGDKRDYTERQRLIVKTIVFGTFYGRSPHSIAKAFGISVAQAELWQLYCFQKYPKLVEYKTRVEKEVARVGYLTSPWGRRRYITRTTQAYNFPVQSSASDITLDAIKQSYYKGLANRLTVHDEIVIQVPFGKEEEHSKLFIETMERKVPEMENFSFPVSYEMGLDWYRMKKVKKEAIVDEARSLQAA